MRKIAKKITNIFILLSLFLSYFTLSASAFEVDYNFLLADEEANNYLSMNERDIQRFLEEKNSFLKDYQYSGNNPSLAQLALDPEKKYVKTRSAAEIIYNAAQEARINPQFILTMLQKEQSLIENSNPTERNLDFAMGYFCYDGQPCNPQYKGFGKQVRSAALQFRWYIDNINRYSFRPGETVCIGDPLPRQLPCTSKGTEVTPLNAITAALYVYTPHIAGNRLFATLWNRYGFGSAIGSPVPPIAIRSGVIPDGALVKAKGLENAPVYLIKDGQRLQFASANALVSRYDPRKVLAIDSKEIELYEDGGVIAHANYSLLEDNFGRRWLIDGLNKRLIGSDEVFRSLGFNPDELVKVSDQELLIYQEGLPLSTAASASPFAQLLKDTAADRIYYVKDGQKSLIIDDFIAKANFPELSVKNTTVATLDALANTGPVKLTDGSLIKLDKDRRVYVVYNGVRRFIPDEATFEFFGYSWSEIKTVSSRVMNLHFLGEDISIE
ncbi:MAG: hypothetical protein PHO91_01875 [Patescibacteria group bacterium]|nr:hypothetical protein [Patescibacteria group bacterium]